MDNPEITQISGPVSLHILEYEGRKFYLLGDFHYPNNFQCSSTVCDSINRGKLMEGGSNCINVDALLQLWLRYNAVQGITTDFFVETPLIRGKLPRRSKKLPPKEEGKPNWLVEIRRLISPCFSRRPGCPFKKIRMEYFDTRQVLQDGERYITDIFLYLLTYLEYNADLMEIKEWTSFFEFIILMFIPIDGVSGNIKYYLDGILNQTGLENLETLREDLLPGLGDNVFVDGLRDTFFNVEEVLKTSDQSMHKSARQLEKLKNSNLVAYQALRRYIKNRLENMQKDFDLVHLKADKILTNLVGGKIYQEDIQDFLNLFMDLGSFLSSLAVDAYAFARMMISDSKEVIVFGGDEHTKAYLTILKSLGANVRISIPQRPARGQSLEKMREVGGIKCIYDRNLPRFIDCNYMKFYLKEFLADEK